MALTIKDIARESGYAVSTVSRALNDHPDVSAEAKAKIRALVEEKGFVPNSNARQLKQQAVKCIAVIVKGANNMLFSAILERAQAQIKQAGYAVIVSYLDEDADEVQQAAQLCRERKPLGILFLGGCPEYFNAAFLQVNVPSVLLTTPAEGLGFEQLSSVTTDDVAGAECAVRHLLEHGHREIGVVGGSLEGRDTSGLRYEGCLRALSQAGISFDKNTYYEKARFSFASAYRAMGRLLDKAPGITAVFTMSDVMAVGAIRALHDRGMRVPEDISVVGYDGIELAEYYSPKLATVRQSQEQLAARGVELLIDRIENGGGPVHETVPFELLEGESVRRIP